jgi:hypothetical protein
MKHEHVWKRVRPVVATIGMPGHGFFTPLDVKRGMGSETYNAECECGARAWVHWPTP